MVEEVAPPVVIIHVPTADPIPHAGPTPAETVVGLIGHGCGQHCGKKGAAITPIKIAATFSLKPLTDCSMT